VLLVLKDLQDLLVLRVIQADLLVLLERLVLLGHKEFKDLLVLKDR
jgi:hypothetical protein